VEDRAGRPRRGYRPADHRLPPAAGHIQVEQDRAPAVLPHLDELARAAADQPRGHRADHCRDHHPHRADRQRRARHRRLPQRHQDPRPGNQEPREAESAPPPRLSRRVELLPRPWPYGSYLNQRVIHLRPLSACSRTRFSPPSPISRSWPPSRPSGRPPPWARRSSSATGPYPLPERLRAPDWRRLTAVTIAVKNPSAGRQVGLAHLDDVGRRTPDARPPLPWLGSGQSGAPEPSSLRFLHHDLA